jgi:hypothetical protein
MKTLFKKSKFWTRVKDTFAIGGVLGQLGMERYQTNHEVQFWIGIGSLGAYLIGLWMEDKNNDGIVDLFEDEQTK